MKNIGSGIFYTPRAKLLKLHEKSSAVMEVADMAVKLLIADDEDMTRSGMEKYIRLHTDRFSKIYTAKNGQEALEIIFTNRPDVMLLDIQMPLKSGLDVMREAKAVDVLPQTIILSGFKEFKYAQQALHYGAQDYMLKPIRSTDILKRILDIVDEIEGRQEDAHDEAEGGHWNIINRAKAYIEDFYMEELTLQRIADEVGISAGYLSTLFPKYLGCGFIDYLNQIRIRRACGYLKQNYLKTYQIAHAVGYQDEKYFSRVFKKVMGMSAREYKKNH